MADVKKGIILKGIGGLYFVETADAVFECKVRGILRKSGQKPLVGDEVDILIGEIYAPCKGSMSVYDHDFSVVSVVLVCCKEWLHG